MKIDLITSRLYNQQLIEPAFEKAGDLVKYFDAIQAQDYAQDKWAVGLKRTFAKKDIDVSIEILDSEKTLNKANLEKAIKKFKPFDN